MTDTCDAIQCDLPMGHAGHHSPKRAKELARLFDERGKSPIPPSWTHTTTPTALPDPTTQARTDMTTDAA